MNDIITHKLEQFLETVKKKMESDDPVTRKYADQFYLNLQKTPDIVKKQMSFHMMHEVWTHMVYPLLVQAVAGMDVAEFQIKNKHEYILELEKKLAETEEAWNGTSARAARQAKQLETGKQAYSDLLVNSMNEIGAQRARVQKCLDDDSYGGWLNTDYPQAFKALDNAIKGG